MYLMHAHNTLGGSWFWRGALTPARAHLEQVMTLYNPQEHRVLVSPYGLDVKVHCLSYMALVLGFLGYLDQARWSSQEALALAQELSHPYSKATALFFTAWLHYARREVQATQEQAEAAIALSAEYAFPFWLSAGTMLRGWALAMQAQIEEGRRQIHQGIASYRATGAEQGRPWALALLAEVYEKAAQSEEGLTVLAEALTLVDKHDERWYEAELHRLKGELLLQQSSSNQTEAESCFHQAIAIAQNQQAKSFELRTATSLAKLWQQQGKRKEAYDFLAPVYHWFTEGFDTADLIEAKALLDELASSAAPVFPGLSATHTASREDTSDVRLP
jgi:predicted ATPase